MRVALSGDKPGADAYWDGSPGGGPGDSRRRRASSVIRSAFAAIAPVSGAFASGPAASDPTYKPSRPVSLITFVGRDDRISSRIYSGLSRWQKNLGCTVGEPVWVDTARTVNRTVSSCPDGSQVVDYTVNGMGHAWPSASGYRAAVDATAAMWEFFAANPRR